MNTKTLITTGSKTGGLTVITATILISILANSVDQTGGSPWGTLRANFLQAFAFENLLPFHLGLPDMSWPKWIRKASWFKKEDCHLLPPNIQPVASQDYSPNSSQADPISIDRLIESAAECGGTHKLDSSAAVIRLIRPFMFRPPWRGPQSMPHPESCRPGMNGAGLNCRNQSIPSSPARESRRSRILK